MHIEGVLGVKEHHGGCSELVCLTVAGSCYKTEVRQAPTTRQQWEKCFSILSALRSPPQPCEMVGT